MARLIKHEAKAPLVIEIGKEKKAICMCGLTGNVPYCDGKHKMTLDEQEGKLYRYEDGKRTEVNN